MKTRDITLTAAFAALAFVATYIGVTTPVGFIHMGTPVTIISALVFGRYVGAFSGSIGMALYDLLSPLYFAWAPVTFISRFLMGWIIGKWGFDQKSKAIELLSIFVGSVVMIVGYFIGNGLLENWPAAVRYIPADIAQVFIGFAIGYPASLILKKYIRQ